MDNKSKKRIQKYMTLYMTLGMSFGVSGGVIFGMIFYPDNMSLGICFGLPIGMCFGMAIGSAKDKRLSENMMEISGIETLNDSSDVMVYAIDKNEKKEYRVTERKLKEGKFSVGDQIAEETDGSLVSLESR